MTATERERMSYPKNQRMDAERNVEPDLTREMVPGSTRRKRKKAKWLLKAYYELIKKPNVSACMQ